MTVEVIFPGATETQAAVFSDIVDDLLWAAECDGKRLRQGFEADALVDEANRLIRDAITPFYSRVQFLLGQENVGNEMAETLRNLYRQGLRQSWKELPAEPPAEM